MSRHVYVHIDKKSFYGYLKMKDVNVATLAKSLGISSQAIYFHTVKNILPVEFVRKIADFLSTNVDQLPFLDDSQFKQVAISKPDATIEESENLLSALRGDPKVTYGVISTSSIPKSEPKYVGYTPAKKDIDIDSLINKLQDKREELRVKVDYLNAQIDWLLAMKTIMSRKVTGLNDIIEKEIAKMEGTSWLDG